MGTAPLPLPDDDVYFTPPPFPLPVDRVHSFVGVEGGGVSVNVMNVMRRHMDRKSETLRYRKSNKNR